MAESPRPPVAVRIVRPYDTEEQFLDSELETVGKTSIILIGAHSRPQGVILRFEVTLQSGHTVLRGEGRVLAFKDSAFRGQPGLALRFTRLDPRSKALVDRAAQLREARLNADASIPPTALPAEPPPPPPPSAPPIPDIIVAIPESMQVIPESVQSVSSAPPTPFLPSLPIPDPVLAEALRAPTPLPPPINTLAAPAPSGTARSIEPPPDRDELLEKLRARASALSPERVAEILRSK